jgi:hypothetical protein
MMMQLLARSARLTGRGALTVATLIGVTIVPVSASAQSNLSSQGFGFPTGQLSARAYGAGGSLAEMDPLSPVNPASVALIPSRMLFMQIEPEFRSVKSTNGSEATTTARYPLIFAAIPFATNFVMSVSASTLLDRTSSTSFNTTQPLPDGENVAMTTTYRIDGAMSDIRLATAWTPASWLRVGVGAHAIAGHNLVTLTQRFDDSLRFSSFSASRVLGFGGGALSGGVQIVSKMFVAAGSARLGGTLHLSSEDTVLTSARVPNRFGASLAYIGIANSTISVRTSHDNWSSLGSLGAADLHPVDAWDTSVGADIAGPHMGQRIVFFRGGYRMRTLPFQAAGETVSEKSITAGVGTAFANNHVLTDLALIRASRSANLSASEKAWTLSIGIAVRP